MVSFLLSSNLKLPLVENEFLYSAKNAYLMGYYCMNILCNEVFYFVNKICDSFVQTCSDPML